MSDKHTSEDLLELQKTLRDDVSGSEARALVASLSKASTVVQARLRERLSQAEFVAAERLAAAIESGDRVVRKVWESMHGKTLQ